MCDLYASSKKNKATGWKIVAERDSKNYSLAMGFCYDDQEMIPVVRVQKPLTHYFVPDIIKDKNPFSFKDNMEGRTAVFLSKSNADWVAKQIATSIPQKGYKIKVKKAKVSVDLLKGNYGGLKVIAGRKIKFLEQEGEEFNWRL